MRQADRRFKTRRYYLGVDWGFGEDAAFVRRQVVEDGSIVTVEEMSVEEARRRYPTFDIPSGAKARDSFADAGEAAPRPTPVAEATALRDFSEAQFRAMTDPRRFKLWGGRR